MTEDVRVPYVYGPLDGQWATLDPRGELAEHPPGTPESVADRYVLVERGGRWQMRYKPDLDTEDAPVDPAEKAAHLAGALDRLQAPAVPDNPARIRARIAELRERAAVEAVDPAQLATWMETAGFTRAGERSGVYVRMRWPAAGPGPRGGSLLVPLDRQAGDFPALLAALLGVLEDADRDGQAARQVLDLLRP